MPFYRPPAPLLGMMLPLLLAAGCAGEGPPLGPYAGVAPEEVAAPEGRVETLPEPTVGYRADVVMTIDDRRFVGRVYAMPGVKRLELPTDVQDVVTVVRADRGETVTWLERTEIEEDPVAAEMAQGHVGLDLRTSEYRVFEVEEIGPERLDDGGPETTRYAYRAVELDGAVREGTLWLTPENILVRFAGKEVEPGREPQFQVMQLENVELGPQPLALFEPPGRVLDPVPPLFWEIADSFRGLAGALFGV